MDDMHRAPGNGDRDPVRDRIRRAVADGRISAADGDIRLGNVGSAASMSELNLIVRDLDQLEATLPAGAPPVPQTTWTPTSQAEIARTAATGSASRTVPFLILGLVVALVVAGGIALFLFSGSDSGSGSESGSSTVELPDPVSPGADPATEEPGAEPAPDASPVVPDTDADGEDFALSAAGVKSFQTFYQRKFRTTKVNDLTMYGDYAVVRVPVPGKKRNAGYLYRDGTWRDFGGVTANFPGTESVDLRKLDVAAMMRNLAKAKRMLNVEDPKTFYVTINYRPQFDEAPNVNIYVSNEFNESGYLATTLDGKIERAYPFS